MLHIDINGRKLTNLRFADDIVIFANTTEQLHQKLVNLINCKKLVGLDINCRKTRIMSNNSKIPIPVNGMMMEYVEEYIYLGQIISFDGRGSKEVKRRINSTWKKYWSLKKIF